jgi:hypothetical protein
MPKKLLNSVGLRVSRQQLMGQAPSNQKFGKKLYITVAAIIIIGVITAAIFVVPSGEPEIISLRVHYLPGEKLTYDVLVSSSSQIDNSSTSFAAPSTLTVEVVSINGDTYTLNYTTTPRVASNSTATSYLMDVKEADMVNLFTLLPVAFQQYPEYAEYVENTGCTNPLETAFFTQSEAKVGDTWQLPVIFAVSTTPDAEITVKFAATQSLEVKAGTFEVFRIEFTQTSAQQSQIQFDSMYDIDVSGESYLEFGSCKQVKSKVQFNMTTSPDVNGSYTSAVSTFLSTLIKDEQPITANMGYPQVLGLAQPVFYGLVTVTVVLNALILTSIIVTTRRKKMKNLSLSAPSQGKIAVLTIILVILFEIGTIFFVPFYEVGLSFAEINLIMQTIWTALVLISMWFRMKSNYFLHEITMLIVISAWWVGFSAVLFMNPFSGSTEIFSSTLLRWVMNALHGIFSIPALVFGTWLVALWRPESATFPAKSKRIAHLTIAFWIPSYVVGILDFMVLHTTIFG